MIRKTSPATSSCSAIIDFHEDRTERKYECALSCGCNISVPVAVASLNMILRQFVDAQREHTCGPDSQPVAVAMKKGAA